MNPNVFASYALLGRLKDLGVTHCVLSPGSRSTPLAYVANELFDTTVVIDERSAGFVALGISEATQVPAVLITTSGSAPTHLYPSVVEAHHSNVPMIVISADRPHEVRGRGAPQTIDQKNLYGTATNFFVDTQCPHDNTEFNYWDEIAIKAFNVISINSANPGVAQINMGMREPLVPLGGEFEEYKRCKDQSKQRSDDTVIAGNADSAAKTELPKELKANTGLIAVGRNCSTSIASLKQLSEKLGWPVLVDVVSNCRNESSFIANYDFILRQEDIAMLIPETILQIGNPLTSKIFNTKMADVNTIALKEFDNNRDPYGNQDSTIISQNLNQTIESWVEQLDINTDKKFLGTWSLAKEKCEKIAEQCISKSQQSEPSVFVELGEVLKEYGEESSLLLASSMPIRYAEWLWKETSEKMRIFSHRGTNGIDGMLASTYGIAKGSKNTTIAMMGDVAFEHDNGFIHTLSNLASTNALKIVLIVINNNGGAIFNHLDQADNTILSKSYEKIMQTPSPINIEKLCEASSVNYSKVEASECFQGVEKVLSSIEPGVSLIEITVEHNSGKEVLARLNEVLK